MIDVVVAGGGPAGLVTALHARRAGLTVEVVEPRSAPIDKACGEGLMPGAVRALRALGVDVPGRALRGIRYTDGRKSVDAPFRDGVGAGVRRTALHDALTRAVHEADIPVRAGRVDDVWSGADAVRVDGRRARYLVAADGLHSPVRRRLGLAPTPGAMRRWGVRAHFPVAPWTDHVEVHWGPASEAYVTPVADDCVGVAILTAHSIEFDQALQGFPSVAGRLDGVPAGPVRGAGPLRQHVRRRVAGRVLLVGDAAGYIDALTGEGLAIGFASAAAAVRAIVRDEPDSYEQAWRRASRRSRALTAALLWTARRAPLRRRIVPLAAGLPAVFGLAVNELAR